MDQYREGDRYVVSGSEQKGWYLFRHKKTGEYASAIIDSVDLPWKEEYGARQAD